MKCKKCGQDIDNNSKVCMYCGAKQSNKIITIIQWIVCVLFIISGLGLIASSGAWVFYILFGVIVSPIFPQIFEKISKKELKLGVRVILGVLCLFLAGTVYGASKNSNNDITESASENIEETIISSMSTSITTNESEITTTEQITITTTEATTITTTTEVTTELVTTTEIIETFQEDTQPKIPTEYTNALKKAKLYSDTMYMSKMGIYNQLTSEYGENFSVEAATYAIDNLDADYNYNALQTAKSYSDNMYMSKMGIYNQLISEYGEQFTPEEAQYAIDNLVADYNYNALQTAKSYQENMAMSPQNIYEQLISEYGEQFTPEEAQYAIDNLI